MKHIKSRRTAISLEYLIGVPFFEEEKMDLSSVVIIAVSVVGFFEPQLVE